MTVEDTDDGIIRGIFIDGVSQGRINLSVDNPQSWYMQEILEKVKLYHPFPLKALVLGGGVGILTSALERMGIETDTIEQSADMLCVSQDHFKFNPKGQVILGDAFIKIKELGKYDLIVVDLFNGIQEANGPTSFFDDLILHLNRRGHVLANVIYQAKRSLIMELSTDGKQ